MLDLVNRRAAEAKVEAVAQAKAAEKAVEGAKQDAKTYEARIGDIAEELARAMGEVDDDGEKGGAS